MDSTVTPPICSQVFFYPYCPFNTSQQAPAWLHSTASTLSIEKQIEFNFTGWPCRYQ